MYESTSGLPNPFSRLLSSSSGCGLRQPEEEGGPIISLHIKRKDVCKDLMKWALPFCWLITIEWCAGTPRDRLASAIYMADIEHVRVILDQWYEGMEMVAQSPVYIKPRDEKGRIALMLCGTDPQDAHMVTNENCGEIGRLLIKAGVDVMAIDDEGWSLVSYVASLGWSKLLGHLVAAGADLDSADKNGLTPLIKAAIHGRDSVVKELIKAGVPACQRGPPPEGWPAMFYATSNSHAQIPAAWLRTMHIFLHSGCDINERDASGRSALMIAASLNSSSAIHLLLENGADPSLRDFNGMTAASVANDKINQKYLEEAAVVAAEAAATAAADSHEAWLAETAFRGVPKQKRANRTHAKKSDL